MNDWSRTIKASVKCKETLASDFVLLIMPQRTHNTIDLLALIINSLLMAPHSCQKTPILNHSILVSEEQSIHLVFIVTDSCFHPGDALKQRVVASLIYSWWPSLNITTNAKQDDALGVNVRD